MFTFIFWIFLFCFHSIQGFIELHKDLLAAIEVFGDISSQIVSSENDTKFQEFADIFNHYVNLTEREKNNRELLSKLTTVNSSGDNDHQDHLGSLEWQNAINDALAEENITIGFQLNNDEFIAHIQNITSTPENLKDFKLQNLDSEGNQSNYKGYGDEDLYSVDPDAGPETTAAEENPFWEADDAPTRRIYKGQRAKIKHYPFIVSVLILSTFACAGSIIKDDLVITAASCLQLAHNNRFFRENPILIEVRVGSRYFVLGGEVIPVTEVYFYPSYDPPTLRNNLAIMRLRRVLKFRKRNVKKIDFDRAPSALPENTPPILIIGWGATSGNNKLHYKERLRVTNLDFYDHHSCKEIYGRKFVAKENFCAGFISRGEGACNHDVGDPGVSGRYLVGVTSFGSPVCGKPDTPTVFTKVGFYAGWIQGIIDQKVPRMYYSTTTPRPYGIYDKPIILYGQAHGEDAPIGLVREGVETNPATQDTAAVDADLQIVLDKLKKLGIENTASEEMLPVEEQDPETKYDGPTPEGPLIHPFIDTDTDRSLDEENEKTLREEDRYKEEEFNNKLSDKGDLDGSDSDISTSNPVDHATKIGDFDTNLSVSREIQKTDVEKEARVTKLPDENVSGENSANDDLNTAETKSTKKGGKRERDFSKSKSNKHLAQKTLKKKHRKRITTNSQFKFTYTPKHSAQRVIQKEYATEIMPPDILGNIRPFDLGYDDKNVSAEYHKETLYDDKTQKQIPSKGLENILKEHHESKSIKEEIGDHDQLHDKLANRLADDIVRSEIQKLIEQLDVSSGEANSQPEDHKLAYKTPLRNDETKDTDKTDDTDTILTFLYLPDKDTENRIQQRVKLSSNEGLSIDPIPFRGSPVSHRANDLVGKSEIYEIFANVMNTVVNKTFV